MKILIDFTQIPVRRAGAGIYAENLIREMPYLLQPNDKLFVLVQNDELAISEIFKDAAQVKIISIPSRIFRNRLALMLFEQLVLPWILLVHRIEVLHSLHYTIPLCSPAVRVVTFHDLTMLLWPKLHTLGRRLIMPLYMRLAWRMADAILFVSESTRRDAQQFFSSSQNVRAVTPLGVSTNAFTNVSKEELRDGLTQIEIDRPYLLFIGTIEPRKNVLLLIYAFEAIADQFPHHILVIVGKLGWDFDPVVQAMTSSLFRERIRHLGYVSDETKRVLLAGCSILVYPSLYEGFGLPVLEGMAAGVPVITSNVSSLPEVAGNGALLVDPTSMEQLTSAMQMLLHDKGLAEEYRIKGRERARTFSWRRTAETTYEAYQSAWKRHC